MVDELEKCKCNKSILKLAKKLKEKRYEVALLSNVSRIDYLKKVRKFSSIFHPYIFLSFKLGYGKPSRKVFHLALKKLNFKPEEVIFVDDRIKHIKSAERIGIIGIHFSSFKKLIKDLRKYGMV